MKAKFCLVAWISLHCMLIPQVDLRLYLWSGLLYLWSGLLYHHGDAHNLFKSTSVCISCWPRYFVTHHCFSFIPVFQSWSPTVVVRCKSHSLLELLERGGIPSLPPFTVVIIPNEDTKGQMTLSQFLNHKGAAWNSNLMIEEESVGLSRLPLVAGMHVWTIHRIHGMCRWTDPNCWYTGKRAVKRGFCCLCSLQHSTLITFPIAAEWACYNQLYYIQASCQVLQ